QDQLGRNEYADVLLHRLLLSVAFFPKDHSPKLDKIIRYQWWKKGAIDSIKHPVLHKVITTPPFHVNKRRPRVGLHIADLRGNDNRSKKEIEDLLSRISKNKSENWIVLGNNSHLSTLNKKKSPFPKHVLWLPEDPLPSTLQTQVRLMQELSFKGINLGGIQANIKQGEKKQ
ncbi:hypothetical protein MNBD_PLANCTO02-1585, partial [hydrothermal vent metagenome]